MTGLTCAEILTRAGLAPVVFEKSRGLGGRLATRRTEAGGIDHGAQYITARGSGFSDLLARLSASGHAATWEPQGRTAEHPWTVGTPGMSSLVRPLAEGVDIRQPRRVTGVQPQGSGWMLEIEGHASEGPFDLVISTIPSPQAAELLSCLPGIEALERVTVHPCWAALLTLAEPLDTQVDMLRPEDGILAWAARNSSKPGRATGPDTWALHATPAWSTDHLEGTPEDALTALSAAFADLVGPINVAQATAHRWRYAMTETPLGAPYLSLAQGNVLVGGDWALGMRVEAAYDSGKSLAEAALARFTPAPTAQQS
ncbi:MAG: FAD-dependent oxidoreductase, partial [Pseudomonadota bacterium]